MKVSFRYMVCLAGFCALLTCLPSCEYQEPDLFDAQYNGVFFNYKDTTELSKSINFGELILNRPESYKVNLKAKLLGHLTDSTRTFQLKAKPLNENTLMARIDSLPDIVFHAGQDTTSVDVWVACPDTGNEVYAVVLYMEGKYGALSEGIEKFEEFTITTGIFYYQPSNWNEFLVRYLGAWDFTKHEFLIKQFFEDDYYYNRDEAFIQSKYSALVDRIRLLGPNTSIEIPFTFWNEPGEFSKPPYWGPLQDQYIFPFSSNRTHATNTWLRICAQEGLTTKTEQAYFTGDEAHMKEINKKAFTLMQKMYNEFRTSSGFYSNPDYFHWTFQVPIFADIDYEVSQPTVWSGSFPLAKAMIDQYYGAYSAEKLKFMIKVAARHNIPYRWFFPVVMNWDDEAQVFSPEWAFLTDESTWEFFNGDQMAYRINRLCREADPSGQYGFPAVEDPSAGGKDKDK